MPRHIWCSAVEVEDSSVLANGPVNVAQALKAYGIYTHRGVCRTGAVRWRLSAATPSFALHSLGGHFCWPYRGWVVGLSLEELQTIKASDKPDDQVPVVG